MKGYVAYTIMELRITTARKPNVFLTANYLLKLYDEVSVQNKKKNQKRIFGQHNMYADYKTFLFIIKQIVAPVNKTYMFFTNYSGDCSGSAYKTILKQMQ